MSTTGTGREVTKFLMVVISWEGGWDMRLERKIKKTSNLSWLFFFMIGKI